MPSKTRVVLGFMNQELLELKEFKGNALLVQMNREAVTHSNRKICRIRTAENRRNDPRSFRPSILQLLNF
jgi:hypothetical protein